MSARQRNRTPGARAGGAAARAASAGFGDNAGRESSRETETSERADEELRGDSPEASLAAEGSKQTGPPRRCTDVCCLVVFLACNVGLYLLMQQSLALGDLRRLRNGFDFRGHLCGASAAGSVSDERSKGDLVLWCPSSVANGSGTAVQWSAPICVERCPDAGSEIHCPTGAVDVEETEEFGRFDGSVTLVSVRRQRLTLAHAMATRRVFQYCLPLDLADEARHILARAESASGWSSAMRLPLVSLEGLLEVPHVVGFIAGAALVAGFVWIVLLRCISKLVVHVAFQLAAMLLLGVAAAIAFAPAIDVDALSATVAAAEPMGISGFGVDSVIKASLSAFSALMQLGAWSGLGSYLPETTYLRLALSALFAAAGATVLLWYCCARKSIAAAADSLREACSILLHQPTLLLVLPPLCMVLSLAALAWTVFGAMAVLSTAEVRAAEPQVFGESVAGVARVFHLTAWHFAALCCWGFAFLWLNEFVKALRSFVLSYTAVRWYSGSSGSRGAVTLLPIFAATRVALLWHLGSLALGAFILACLCALRWVLVLLHKLAADHKERRGVQILLAGFDCLVKLAEEVVRRINSSAFTELALSSSSFCAASSHAASVMLSGAPLLWMRDVILRPAKLIGGIAFAALFGFVVYFVLSTPVLPASYDVLPASLVEELLSISATQAGSGSSAPPRVPALAVTGAALALAAVMSFTAVLDGLADAMLYLFLRDGASDAPLHLRKFVSPLAGSGDASKNACGAQ